MQPLFVYAGANLHLADMWAYAPVAGAYVLARTLAKTLTVYGCGLAFGYEHKQAVSTGLLLVPMAGLAIGLVQTTTTLMPELARRCRCWCWPPWRCSKPSAHRLLPTHCGFRVMPARQRTGSANRRLPLKVRHRRRWPIWSAPQLPGRRMPQRPPVPQLPAQQRLPCPPRPQAKDTRPEA